MDEYTLKRLYGGDFISQQKETNGALLTEEQAWYDKHCPEQDIPYDYQYVLQGIRTRRRKINHE